MMPVPGLSDALDFFGDFEYCNRPVLNMSYLSLSTASVPGGISATGKLTWDCQFSQCGIAGGSISITYNWIKAGKRASRSGMDKTNEMDFDAAEKGKKKRSCFAIGDYYFHNGF
jgi:hypothetical protein